MVEEPVAMIIDVHSHLHDPALCERVGVGLPRIMLDPEALVEEQACSGINRSVISGPRLMDVAVEKPDIDTADIALRYNEFAAGLVRRYPDRFLALGIADPAGGDAMHRTMERAVGELGLKGFIVSPMAGGKFLDAGISQPFFELCHELGAVVFVHNSDSCLAAEHMPDFRLAELVGRPNDMTILAARLAFSGLMERLPGLKLLLGRLGGAITLYAGRIQQGWEVRHTRKPSPGVPAWGPDNIEGSFLDQLRCMHVDTQTFHPPAIACAVATMGAERVLLGTDYPPVPRDRAASVADVRQAGLSADETGFVLGGNAQRLFGMEN